MPEGIAILEDDANRIAAFRNAATILDFKIRLGSVAADMIEILKNSLPTTALISLDHDLGPNLETSNGSVDPGTGRQVVDWMVTQKPICPVILHTSNSFGRDRMEFALKAAGWSVEIVSPNAKEWGDKIWLPTAKRMLSKYRKF